MRWSRYARGSAHRTGIVLAAPALETRRALAVSGLDRFFEIREKLEDAFE